jgi:AraC-like DNA-binding protein
MAMDVLTDVLRQLRLQNLFYGRMEFSAPWGLRFPGLPGHFPFYVLARGSCVLELERMPALTLSAGDAVFLPHGGDTILKDSPGSKVLLAESVMPQCHEPLAAGPLRYGGGGTESVVLGGMFSFEHGAFEPFLRSLPPMIHLKEDSASAPWFEAVRKQMNAEIASDWPGSKIVISRLADLFFIQALRAHLDSCQAAGGGWLKALQDPHLGPAIAQMHEAPGKPWTVESLAQAAGLSRSAFAARFGSQVGEGPLAYLTRWRMEKADTLLQSRLPIESVATQLGYASAPAFSRAFKRLRGAAPGSVRTAKTPGPSLQPEGQRS